MKPRTQLATARTPDGHEMLLFAHDGDFSIKVDSRELMNSRQHESELELARLGCASLTDRQAARVFIGGLGLGYTLRQTLDMLRPDAGIVVSELVEAVVAWHEEFLGALTDHPLHDERVQVIQGDAVQHIAQSDHTFDAILLDIDNGPGAFTDVGNQALYGRQGIVACRRALRPNGCLAVWSSEPSKRFEQLLVQCGFHVRRYRAPAYKGSKSQTRFIWLASEEEAILPPGGGKPKTMPFKSKSGRTGRNRNRAHPRNAPRT